MQVLNRIGMIVDLALDQEIIEVKPRLPKQLAGLKVCQSPGAVPFDGKAFKSLSARIGVLGDIIRQLDGNLHGFRIAPATAADAAVQLGLLPGLLPRLLRNTE